MSTFAAAVRPSNSTAPASPSEPKSLRRRASAQEPAPAQKPAGSTRAVIHPFHAPEGIDVTEAIVSAVAHELWKRYAGNAVLNWVEAERCVAALLASPSRATRTVPGRHHAA